MSTPLSIKEVPPLAPRLARQVEEATITICDANGELEGRGVYVGNGLILTAAHCVTHDLEEADFRWHRIEGDNLMIHIRVAGQDHRVSRYAIELCKDLAVLGPLDSQAFCEWAEPFDQLCERLTPVSVCETEFQLFHKFPVHVYTHEGKWIRGLARQSKPYSPMLAVDFETPNLNGTSGSAIVNESGNLVGIYSTEFGGGSYSVHIAPRPHDGAILAVAAIFKERRVNQSIKRLQN